MEDSMFILPSVRFPIQTGYDDKKSGFISKKRDFVAFMQQ